MEAEKTQFWLPLLRLSHRVVAGLSVGVVALTKTPKSALGANVSQAAEAVDTQAFWLLPLLLLSVPFLEWMRRKVEARTDWKIVESALVELRDRIFPTSGDPTHYHRVTLFRRQRYCWGFRKWPNSGWMVPVARSCHTTRNSSAIFMAPDDADRAEGIAGTAWTMEEMLMQDNLPSLSNSSSREDIDEYARRTFVKSNAVHRRVSEGRPPLSRSLCGIPIRVKGRNWGAIVVDSRNVVMDVDRIRDHYKTVAGILSKLLERL